MTARAGLAPGSMPVPGTGNVVAASPGRTTVDETEPVLQIRGLRKSYANRVVLDGVDLDVRAGELVALLGANGSGKSTTLKCVVGLAEADGGAMEVAGQPVRPQGGGGTAHRQAAMVFQQIHLVRRRSVLDNVCAGALGRLPWRQSWSSVAFPRSLREEAMACLDRVGLSDRPFERAGRLSGGQQQRVAIARALCQRAPLLLADEPVSALDPAAAEQVMALLGSLAAEDRIAVAAVLHQPDLARRHADRIVGLAGGRVAFAAAPGDVDDAAVTELYSSDLTADSDSDSSRMGNRS